MKSKKTHPQTWAIIIRTFLPIPKNIWCLFGISIHSVLSFQSVCWGTLKEYDCTKVVYYVHLLCWVLVYMTLLPKWTRAEPHRSKNGLKGRPPNHSLTQKVTWWTLIDNGKHTFWFRVRGGHGGNTWKTTKNSAKCDGGKKDSAFSLCFSKSAPTVASLQWTGPPLKYHHEHVLR